MKISKRAKEYAKKGGDYWTGSSGFRYPHDLDKFEGDPAGEGGGYHDPTHLRLPHTGHEEQTRRFDKKSGEWHQRNTGDPVFSSGNVEGEGTCRICHGRTYEPVESRLAQGDPKYQRCENCGHEEKYPKQGMDGMRSYKVHGGCKDDNCDVTMTDEYGRPMSPKEQERLGLNKKYKERYR